MPQQIAVYTQEASAVSISGMLRVNLVGILPTHSPEKVKEILTKRQGKDKHKMGLTIAEFMGSIFGEELCLLYSHGANHPDNIYGSAFTAMITHKQHSFVGINYYDGLLVMLGYAYYKGVPEYFTVEIPYEDYQAGQWYPVTVVNREINPHQIDYVDKFMACDIVPKESVRYDPEIKREIMTRATRSDGIIYMTSHTNPNIPKTGAAGNVYVKNYKEKDGKIQFMFAFYGNVMGEYVAFDTEARGSMQPNYKMMATGFGMVKGETKHLYFSFSMNGTRYVFRYSLPYDVTPRLNSAYWVSTSDNDVNALLKEVPESMVVSPNGAESSIDGKPIFQIDYRGQRVYSSPDNVLEDDMARSKIVSKKKIQTVSLEDAEAFFNPKSHLKERPELVDPEYGLVDHKRVMFSTMKNISKLKLKNVEALQEDRIIRVNIIHPDGAIVFRMRCAKTEVVLSYMNERETWTTIKKFSAANQGKAIGRLIKLVSSNANPDSGDDEE